jgi:sugar (pentulose or hexulose) kinase
MFLGLDFGTSGARACVIDPAKTIVWEQRVAYVNPAGQTPLDWRGALHALLSALPKNIAAQLRGLAIDGTSATVLLCDAQLEPLHPCLLYHDSRAQQQAEQLKTLSPGANLACTATSGLAKFMWLTQQGTLPKMNVDHAAYFLHQADWLTALLSGQPGISDYHNALKTGYDVEELCWPDWIMALPHAHLLPQVLAPGEVIGPIQPNIASHFGIHPHCMVHAGTTDSNAAFIASDIHEAGVGVTSLGSTLVLKQLVSEYITAPEYGVYSHRYGNLWLVGGASNAGGTVLRHYFSDEQLAALSERINPLQDSPLDYYPLAKPGERFPINDAQLAPRPLRSSAGKVSPRPVNDEDFLHGLLQGLARIEAAGYARLTELGAPPVKRIITNGGGAKNKVWGKMRSRLLAVPITAAVHSEAAYGSALLCLFQLELGRRTRRRG